MIVPDSKRARLVARGDDGSTAILPLVEDWAEWWALWGPRIRAEEGAQPWILFLLDAHEKIMEVNAIMARIMLGKPGDLGVTVWSEKEWLNVEETALEVKSWFEKHVGTLENLPEFAAFIVAALYANLNVLTRLARDLRCLQELHGVGSHIIEKRESDGALRVVA